MEEMSLEQGLEEIGHKILVLTRNELYMKMRFMDVALSAFYYVQDFSVDLLATDGETMYFNGQMLGGEYRQNRIEVNRAYLHLVALHFPTCISQKWTGRACMEPGGGYCGRICD